jgi:ferredoxin
MALQIIADLCTACADCEPDCPTASIRRKKGVYIINPDTCTECDGDYAKPKCVELCPIDNCIVALAA